MIWIKGSAVKIIILSGIFFLAACSVQEHYRLLSFFFDDVPDPNIEKTLSISNNPNGVNDSLALSAGNLAPKLFFHEPYSSKDCNACHNRGSMGSLSAKQPDLCYQCHSNFSDEYSFQHGPVGGYCTNCHQPHKAKENKLLLIAGREMCLNCHDESKLTETAFHFDIGDKDCTSCHNPHGGSNRGLLKKGACYQCHENFKSQYNYLHGPVASDLCGECHTSHLSGRPGYVLSQGRDLCFNCHEREAILEGETHSGIEDASCTDCHNPHGGEDRFIFN